MGCAPYVYKDMLELLLLYFSKLRRGKWDQRKILLLTRSIIRICPSARELLWVVKLLMGLGYCWGDQLVAVLYSSGEGQQKYINLHLTKALTLTLQKNQHQISENPNPPMPSKSKDWLKSARCKQ